MTLLVSGLLFVSILCTGLAAYQLGLRHGYARALADNRDVLMVSCGHVRVAMRHDLVDEYLERHGMIAQPRGPHVPRAEKRRTH